MNIPATRQQQLPATGTRTRAWTGVLRQIWWTSIPVWSIGFLSFVPFLRIALERRRKTDWVIFAAYLGAVIALAAITATRTHGAATVAGGAYILGLMGVATAHTAVTFRPSRTGPRQDANDRAIEAARHRMARRVEALKLARSNPALAWELRIGRPDLPREYDDGGLVDLNHVPAYVLAGHLGLAPDEVKTVVAARDKLGAFTSVEELVAYDALTPERADELRDLMIFR
jgi:hypothetical protein